MQLGELPAHVGVWKALLFRMRRSLGGLLCLVRILVNHKPQSAPGASHEPPMSPPPRDRHEPPLLEDQKLLEV